VSEETISVATEIPMQGEKWFKGMPLDTSFYIDFLKPEYKNQKIGASIPREYVLEPYEKLLRVIRKYFTCEGRFDKVYQYHIRLLMHFIGRSPLNLPFFLYRSLGKMADTVQARADQPKSSLFHFSLVKLLVVEEIGKLKRDWDSLLTSTNISLDPKGDTPLSAEKSTSHSSGGKGGDVAERRKGKEIENPSLSQPVLKERRKLQFTDEPKETQAPSKLRTRSSARRFPIPTVQTEFVEFAAEEIDEEQVKPGEKDANVKEMQQQLKKVQHIIAQLYQENKELKKKLIEKTLEAQTPQSKASHKSPTSSTEGERNIKWLKKKLREAQDQIIKLREEKRISEEGIMNHYKK
jgi:hypothetical protein